MTASMHSDTMPKIPIERSENNFEEDERIFWPIPRNVLIIDGACSAAVFKLNRSFKVACMCVCVYHLTNCYELKTKSKSINHRSVRLNENAFTCVWYVEMRRINLN